MQGTLTQAPDRAKEIASARPLGSAELGELARIKREFPEFEWVGEQLLRVPRYSLMGAAGMVRYSGADPQSEAVARTLGVSVQDVRDRELLEDTKRRVRRAPGAAPAGKPLEARRAHVWVGILLAFAARLASKRPRLPDGRVLDAASAAVLGVAGLVDAPGHEAVQLHPRASRRVVRILPPEQQAQVEAELDALERGDFGRGEWRKPLPDDACSATKRNHRRVAEARALYDEQRRYKHQQKLERLAGTVGGRVQNPAGIRPLPLHEGRKALEVAREREATLRFIASVPPVLRVRLFSAATRGGQRGRLSREARLVIAFYAYLLWQSQAPRPSMRRDGFHGAVEGLCREALAVAFAWNEFTEEPYHANTMSRLARELEEAGLLVREAPNGDGDAYTGVTGWALYVYRLRNAQQLSELLRALLAPAAPQQSVVATGEPVDTGPS